MTPLTKPYLRRLRNEIDLRTLIVEVLDLEHRYSDGRWHFLCPLCREFNTAVNPATTVRATSRPRAGGLVRNGDV